MPFALPSPASPRIVRRTQSITVQPNAIVHFSFLLRLVPWPCLALGLLSLALLPVGRLQAGELDLRPATVFAPSGLSAPERQAVRMLIEETEKRSHLRWNQTNVWPAGTNVVIAVGTFDVLTQAGGSAAEALKSGARPDRAEGYRLSVQAAGKAPVVTIAGHDARGVLFGVGRLLREMALDPGRASVPDRLELVTAPAYPLRGHQLGYRPKCNSYDAWDVPTWEQYYRDLAVFGCNAIELIPPRTDDDADSPHFPRPPLEMMVEMSRLAADYGLDLWIWYPAMDKDYADPATVDAAVAEWAEVFKRLPRLDAVFVPGGDPGHTPPKALLGLLEKQTESLHRFHPRAQMWVSPQGFNQEWYDEFIGILTRDKPAWLSGIVFGPQVRVSLPRLREQLPAQYPIRHYPDITHSRQCQFPVPDWDAAFAVTEGRECINPRPEGEAVIFRALQPATIGFLTYSEGCNDDVNKCVWSALGWDPEARIADVLRQYGRYYIGAGLGDDFGQGLLALERNWRGPLLANAGVETTLAQFQDLERRSSFEQRRNWRFQQALLRAYYDALVRRRLLAETELEAQATDALRRAPTEGALVAMARAEATLDRGLAEPVAPELRLRVAELGEALFQSIRMQLHVAKYGAIAPDRGAMLETLDYPLNDRPWLKDRFARIRALPNETERLGAIAGIVNWADPGPGGFYDDLGNIARQPHLVREPGFERDPACVLSPRVDFEEDLVVDEPEDSLGVPRRRSWIDHAESLYDAPLRLRYTGLDPAASYKVRVAYAGDNPKRKLRLVANERFEVHPLMPKPLPFKLAEFAVPREATAGGDLELSWFAEPGLGGNGRGCQVSEVWLIKNPSRPQP